MTTKASAMDMIFVCLEKIVVYVYSGALEINEMKDYCHALEIFLIKLNEDHFTISN